MTGRVPGRLILDDGVGRSQATTPVAPKWSASILAGTLVCPRPDSGSCRRPGSGGDRRSSWSLSWWTGCRALDPRPCQVLDLGALILVIDERTVESDGLTAEVVADMARGFLAHERHHIRRSCRNRLDAVCPKGTRRASCSGGRSMTMGAPCRGKSAYCR